MRRKHLYLFLVVYGIWLIPHRSFAQDSTANKQNYSLQQAIDYALANNINIKNAQLDTRSANARVGEIRAVGLPQINAEVDYSHWITPQQSILENIKSEGNLFYNPDAPEGSVVAFSFLLKNTATASITASQLLFSASYLVGLRAANTYKELATKNVNQSKIGTIEAVTKAYYGVLVNRERLELLKFNIDYLDTLVRETRVMYDNGFVEKIDIDRLEVQLNNLKFEQEKVERLQDLSVSLLKFQMGLKVNAPIALTDSLNDEAINTYQVPATTNFDYKQRNEFATLQTQKELAFLDIRNNQSGYYPSLAAYGTFGYNTAANKVSNIFKFSERYFEYSLIGLKLSIPIFDGLTKKYKVQQARITYDKANQSMTLLQNSIDLEIQQSTINVTNNLEALKTQKRNIDLANEVLRVTRIKYQQGVGSNIEVNNALTAYKEAETNYYSALYDALIAKVDLDKATGQLLTTE